MNEATEIIGLFDVTTDVDTLNFNEGINLAIFEDLGTGTSYGEFIVSAAGSSTDVLEFGLNAAALVEMNLHLNQFFSIGGRLLSDDGTDGIFGDSSHLQPMLEIRFVPEPSTALLLAAGLIALGIRRRRGMVDREGSTMRNPRVRVAAILVSLVVVLGFAGAAKASTISFVWISTSHAATGVGTPNLFSFIPGDTAVLEIRVNVTSPGVAGIGVSMDWSPSNLLGLSEQICPGPTTGNPFGPGVCGVPPFSDLLNPFSPTPVIDNATGSVGFVVLAGVSGGGQRPGAVFELAHVTFSSVGLGTTAISPFFRPGGINGEVPIGGGFFIPTAFGATASTEPIPEPGSFALLVLGFGALAFMGRRSR